MRTRLSLKLVSHATDPETVVHRRAGNIDAPDPEENDRAGRYGEADSEGAQGDVDDADGEVAPE